MRLATSGLTADTAAITLLLSASVENAVRLVTWVLGATPGVRSARRPCVIEFHQTIGRFIIRRIVNSCDIALPCITVGMVKDHPFR